MNKSMPYNGMYLSVARACDRQLDQTQVASGLGISYLTGTVSLAESFTLMSLVNSKKSLLFI